jgi:hypothetical protein
MLQPAVKDADKEVKEETLRVAMEEKEMEVKGDTL